MPLETTPLETMKFEKDGYVGRLTLNRPHILNAVNYQGALELKQAAQGISDDPDLRIVLIRGEGRAFCTGIDLKELSAGGTPQDYFQVWEEALRIFEQAEKIILCVMHGYALGGGLQLPLACDIRIATEDCLMGLPAAPESFVPGLGTYRLPRYVGLGRAKWMVLSGENIDGRRGHEFGLVDHLVKSDSMDQEVEELVERYLGLSSAGALQSKILLGVHKDLPYDEFLEEYLRRQAIAVASPDHDEAMNAYREGRNPVYSAKPANPTNPP